MALSPRRSRSKACLDASNARHQLAGQRTRIVSHRGSPAGGTVSLLTFPDLGVAIAVAANVTDAMGVDPFALQVAEAFTRH